MTRLSHTLRLLTLSTLTLALLSSGCRSTPEASNARSGERRVLQTGSTMEKPSAEELEGNPCGNPDWAKLPPEVGQLSDAEDTEAPSSDAPEDEAR
ncbi:hypothetical protein FRC98_04475 [Lujinxingia vulgaris]|uniref:Secreted protein n=1 Tax=Lujinxingia vulgaris TaxID=2600176 RepID=A0A5C6XJ03_9DELT|nr:hypothetical protein [Lujinxingia vulgaris]TXD38160.1 hypothetical protein FRC98_04475 [Lujinxingia vulgaris]